MVAMKKNIAPAIIKMKRYSQNLPAVCTPVKPKNIIVTKKIRNSFSKITVIRIPQE